MSVKACASKTEHTPRSHGARASRPAPTKRSVQSPSSKLHAADRLPPHRRVVICRGRPICLSLSFVDGLFAATPRSTKIIAVHERRPPSP